MKKSRLPALAAALCMLATSVPMTAVSAVPMTVSAASTEQKFTEGSLTYTINDQDGSVTITACEAGEEKVVIPEELSGRKVTAIGNTAFFRSSVTSVVIPEGVTVIGSGSFWHCKALTEVSLPSTLTSIESYAFNDCQSLEKIDIPDSVTSFGNAVFEDTPWLTAKRESSDFLVINGVLIDAYGSVDKIVKAQEEAKAAEEAAAKAPWVRNQILINQIGYFPQLEKRATLLSDAAKGIAFEVLDEKGKSVYKGTSTPHGLDADSGDQVHVLDFSSFTKEGTYTLKAGDAVSQPFRIGIADAYNGLLNDGLNYFYQARSGMAIEQEYITSGITATLARSAAHAPDVATIQHVWGYEASSGKQDVTGGWYDAGDHGKYVVNGGISLWLLQNQYERGVLLGREGYYADGTMTIPENGNGLPDLLDETRYEMEWMLKMIVQDGECKDMVYHKMHDDAWTGLPLDPARDLKTRIIMPPSTAATLNLAACGAQAARLWKDYDPDFAAECLEAAEKAYAAALAHPKMYAPDKDSGGGGAYGDSNVTDEFYWAACELYITTGEESYYTDLKASDWAFTVPIDMTTTKKVGFTGCFDWGHTSTLGSFSLLLHQDVITPAEGEALRQDLQKTADYYADLTETQGYGVPFSGEVSGNYPWGSNSFVADNAVVMAYAYDQCGGDAKYLNAIASTMDYLLGRNPLDNSYVTGYGYHASKNPHHRWWGHQLRDNFPSAPGGVLVGGPNSNMDDPKVKDTDWGETTPAPQCCYLDHIEAYSVNEVTINWNSPLTWVTSFLLDTADTLKFNQPSAANVVDMRSQEELDEEAARLEAERLDALKIRITLPEGITTVGEQIFGSRKNYVNGVVIPEGVTSISRQAFYQCSGLEELTLPETLQDVGDQAFGGTPWLKSVMADSTMLIINNMLIDGSTAAGDVEIPEGVTTILGGAFRFNEEITSVKLPSTLITIGKGAFYDCTGLTAIEIPASVQNIEAEAFKGTGLTSLTIPATVRSVGDEAFVNCDALTEATLENPNLRIGTDAFGVSSTFTTTGQYSYIFVRSVNDKFVVHCIKGSTGDTYAKRTGVTAAYLTTDGPSTICGDVDLNGEVDILDVILLNKSLMIGTEIEPQGLINADTDLSGGDPTELDSLNILKYIVGLLRSLPT